MIIKGKVDELICFGARVTHTNIENHIIHAGMCYYRRGLNKQVELFNMSGERLGLYEVPKELTRQMIHGYCAAATLVRIDKTEE